MAEQPPAVATLLCTQCGGELHPDEGQVFLTCPYCGATVYVDKSQVVFHWYLAPTLTEADARAELGRWMAGNETVKDLDKKAKLLDGSFAYFPLWYFKHRRAGGEEEVLLEPAAATSVTELRRLNLPAGDLKNYDTSIDAQATAPNVPLQTAQGWLAGRQVPVNEIVEQALVHIPIFSFKYLYQDRTYTAVVEAGTGTVFANIYPAKAEAPYRLVGWLAALIFLCLATFPIIGGSINGSNGTALGFGVCLTLGALLLPVLFALAVWVAAKV